MPNTKKNFIDKDGLHTESYEESFNAIVEAYKIIYGSSINTDSNSPDGQVIGIYAQAKQDMLDLITQIYNCFNVDTVIGRAQDVLYKLIGIFRKSSEFTFVRVFVTTNRSISLQGLDDKILDTDVTGYTASDMNGNQFILVNSISLGVGIHSLEFRAKEAGAIECLPNTIVNPVTVVLGVVSVNNPEREYFRGEDEETDADFRLRMAKSTAISAQGFDDSLEAQILNIATVTDCHIEDNRKKQTDAYGTEGHTVWCIVEGGNDDEIARVLYGNVTQGAGMRGEIVKVIKKKNGLYEDIMFDRGKPIPLYIKCALQNLSTYPIDEQFIKNQLATKLFYKLNEAVDTSDISCLLKTFGKDFVPFNIDVSLDNENWYKYLKTPTPQNKFYVSESNITIEITEL